jgi:hypothetical protein
MLSDKNSFLEEKALLLSRKKSLQEEMANLRKGHIAWLEPLLGWIKDAETIEEIAVSLHPTLRSAKRGKILGKITFV